MRPALWYALILCLLVHSNATAQATRGGRDEIDTALRNVDHDIEAFKRAQFVRFAPNYINELGSRERRVRELASEIHRREAAGKDVRCAHHILTEATWLLHATAEFARADARLADLSRNLVSSSATAAAATATTTTRVATQDEPCLTLWFYQLDAAYDRLQDDRHYHFPPALLDRVNSPESLTRYFMSVAVSDIAHQGVDHQEELNEPLADLIRLIVRDRPPGNYTFDAGLKEAMRDVVLHKLRDPTTGYWGERYIVDGHVQFIPDLSTTFHVVSYLRGDVPELGKVIDTTLAVKDRESPVGWLRQGRHDNHNGMDVVRLFKWGWPAATAEQKREVALEIQRMIDRCLSESLQPDGSFQDASTTRSIEEATYFGAMLLADAGFFDQSRRFWTDHQFADAETVRRRIVAFIQKHQSSGGAGGVYYRSALEALGAGAAGDQRE